MERAAEPKVGKMNAKPYMDYLDKEMTIMGILSAFSIAAPSGILVTVIGKDSQTTASLWTSAQAFIIAGSIFCVIAASLFYKQRADLAYYYGQMSLTLAHGGDRAAISNRLAAWCEDADAWRTWFPYLWGFILLFAGFTDYFLAMIFFSATMHWQWLAGHLHNVKVITFTAVPLVALSYCGLEYYVRTLYKDNSDPWSKFWEALFRRKQAAPLPHIGVYARLRPSKLHGVGVFAIVPIPADTYIFEPDNDELVTVSEEDVAALPEVVRKLYIDFCPKIDTNYECPSTFNRLTPSWFLNDSQQPNVAADAELKFYALRDISPGEELTSNYSTYSNVE